MNKPINALAQTGALEDLIWSIMNDAETEAHYDRMKQSYNRDIENSENVDEKDEINLQLVSIEEAKNKVREVRYMKTLLATEVAKKVAEKKSNEKFSCVFKHQLLSMAEIRDSIGAIDDEELSEFMELIYTKTVNNTAYTISNFLGLNVESCMACLFEKNKIERSIVNED